MTTVSICQSGVANIVGLPKAVITALGLHVGSKLNLSIENNKIVLSPVVDELTLESLLSGSPKKCFAITDEDREWLDEPSVGREI